jgi:adenylate cyclase
MGREDLANSGKFQRWRDLNIEMLSHYRHRDWAAALAAIERGRSLDEERRFKTLYDVYAARIQAFQAAPPPDDWDGAYALESK